MIEAKTRVTDEDGQVFSYGYDFPDGTEKDVMYLTLDGLLFQANWSSDLNIVYHLGDIKGWHEYGGD